MILKTFYLFLLLALVLVLAKNEKKKDIRDYNDRDLEKLYEQWEEDDEPLPVDELPEWDPRKPRPSLDLSDMSKFGEPEDFLKASKKGQSVMMFVRVSGSPTRHEAEEVSSIWQTGLWNNHVHVDRFMVEDDRAIFLFKDGSLAWEALDYLLNEERVADVQLDQKTYHGYHTPEGKKEKAEKESKDKKKEKKKPKKKVKKDKKKDEL